MRSFVVGISAEKLDVWFKAVPGLKEYDSYALKNKLDAYRQHHVTPAFAAEVGEAASAFHRGGMRTNFDTETTISLYELSQEGIATNYIVQLFVARATPEDISRFWGDGVELEYALSLLGR